MAVTTSQTFDTVFSVQLSRINDFLKDYLTAEPVHPVAGPERLWGALRYGTLQGGKRIRPLLVLETARACASEAVWDAVLPTACAIELVHAQSLIHDDLPCMDDDDLRRGQPTVHKAYDEATAVLAGDALLAMAFGLIARRTPLSDRLHAETLLSVVAEFSSVTSVEGLVNGQYVDIYYEGRPFDAQVLDYIHTYKTGALITFSVRAGARLAGASPEELALFTQLGRNLGLAFQIVDDLLDVQSTPEALGKTPGKDQAQQKATYPALYGIESSRQKVDALTAEADALLDQFLSLRANAPTVPDVQPLRTLIDFLCHRIH